MKVSWRKSAIESLSCPPSKAEADLISTINFISINLTLFESIDLKRVFFAILFRS